jgi:uncharacterized protein
LVKIFLKKKTLYTYVNKLEYTLTVFFVRKFSKVFICDTGLSKILRFSPDAVFLDLVRKKNVNTLLEIFHLKFDNIEVNFVLKEGLNIKQLIQVTYASSKNEIEKREIKALIRLQR